MEILLFLFICWATNCTEHFFHTFLSLSITPLVFLIVRSRKLLSIRSWCFQTALWLGVEISSTCQFQLLWNWKRICPFSVSVENYLTLNGGRSVISNLIFLYSIQRSNIRNGCSMTSKQRTHPFPYRFSMCLINFFLIRSVTSF